MPFVVIALIRSHAGIEFYFGGCDPAMDEKCRFLLTYEKQISVIFISPRSVMFWNSRTNGLSKKYISVHFSFRSMMFRNSRTNRLRP